jgi:hypothetical protein
MDLSQLFVVSRHMQPWSVLAWWHAVEQPQTTILVHGDQGAMRSFAAALPRGSEVLLPALHGELDL